MAEPDKCTNVLGAAKDTVVLGIKLVGDAGKDFDTYLANALKSDDVQNEIRKALNEIAKEHLQITPLTFSGQEAKRMATALLNRSAAAIGQDVFNQVQKSPQYLRLRTSAENVLTSLKCSPVGIWYEANKTMIYILAAGVIVAGAVGMYVTRAGDAMTDPLTKLIGKKKFTAKPIGTLEVSAGGFKFVPSKREFQIELGAAADYKQIRVELSVTAHAIDTDVSVASAGGKVIIPFGKVVTRVEGSYDPRNLKIAPVQLGLGIGFPQGALRFDLAARVQFSHSRPTGGSVGVGVKGNFKGIPIAVDLGGKLDNQSGSTVLGTIGALW